jgi:hypothetical protein
MTARARFYFDMNPERLFDGVAVGTTWNGFDNVMVTPEVASEIDEFFRRLEDGWGYAPDNPSRSDPIAEMPVGPDGLIDLSNGFATVLDEE